MFPFSKPKKTLFAVLEKSIDIHNHLLPGIDDGAKTATETLELIDLYNKNGITRIIATPHIMSEHYPNTPLIINEKLNSINAIVAKNKMDHIHLTAAAEYLIDDNFEQLLSEGKLLTLKGQYVLVELSYYNPPINLYDIIYNITVKGYIPVLAHPERYLFFYKDDKSYKKLKDLGCLFQMNLLSLTPYYGSDITKNAQFLLKNDYIDLVASDIHNKKQLELLETFLVPDTLYFELRKCSLRARNLFF